MENAFTELLALLADEHTMSAYELHSSGLVQSLFSCLNVSSPAAAQGHRTQIGRHQEAFSDRFVCLLQNNDEPLSNTSKRHAVERINLFKSVFRDLENGYVQETHVCFYFLGKYP